MSERITLTMSVETFRIVHALALHYGGQNVRILTAMGAAGMMAEDKSKKAMREIECLTSYMITVPLIDVIQASDAEIFQVDIAQDPGDDPVYQHELRKVMEAMGTAPRAS